MKTKQLIKLDLSYGNLPEFHPLFPVEQKIPNPFVRPPKLEPSKFPWPLKDESVEEALSMYWLNRIPGELRGKFMDELWRVLIPQGKATIIVPYWSSPRSIQSPHSAWPPLCEQSFLYFTKDFRKISGESNTCTCDFEFVAGHALEQDTVGKNDELRSFWAKHYLAAVNDLHITATKKT